VKDYALEGRYEVNGVACKPGFELFREILEDCTPEKMSQLTDVPERLTAARVSELGFASSLAAGRDLAYVLPLPGRVLDRCAMIAGLGSRMPWAAPVDLRRVLVPLVETRSQAIVRHGIGTVLLDWDGTPYVAAVEGR